MNRTLFAAAAMMASALGTAADASELFPGLKAGDCVDGVVPNATLRDKAVAGAKIPLTVPIATALVEARLGTLARKAEIDCLGKVCEGGDAALRDLHHGLLGLADASPLAPEGFTIRIDPAAAPQRVNRAEAFLNGDHAWVVVRCPNPVATAGNPDAPEVPRRPSETETPALVIGRNEDDAGKDFGKRGFASIGFSSDREAKATQWDIDAFVGYNAPILSRDLEIQPFASLQYHTGKKVDDLSVGGALMWYPNASGNLIRLKGAWETDHRFRSSLWRADLGWTPPLLDSCEESTVPDRSFANCEITLVADYENVADAGGKPDLLNLNNFVRFGLDSRFTYGHSIGDKFGFVIASAGFSFRQDPGGSRSDAEVFTASLGLTPSSKGAWKVSIDYTNGRDLTDLTKQNRIVLSVGFRR